MNMAMKNIGLPLTFPFLYANRMGYIICLFVLVLRLAALG
jgi:hypothetical protein